jgi:hypothetical protein
MYSEILNAPSTTAANTTAADSSDIHEVGPASNVGSVGNKVTLGQVFLRQLRFLLIIIIPSVFHTRLSTWQVKQAHLKPQ